MADVTAGPKTCSVCGDPIRRDNTIGICTKRSRPDCRAAYGRAQYERHAGGSPEPEPGRCEVCGRPLRVNNQTGLCSGDDSGPACKSARSKKGKDSRPSRVVPAAAREACPVCGGKLRADNKIGVCKRTAECREEIRKRRVRLMREEAARTRQPRREPERPRHAPAMPTGTRFGRWVTLEETPKGGDLKVWCRCSCPRGTEARVFITNLKRGVSRSCGCLRSENSGRPRGAGGVYLPAGSTSGLLVTLEDAPYSYSDVLTRCGCPARTELTRNAQRLKAGKVESCGCLKNKAFVTHGLSGHPLYGIWRGIVGRGTDPANRDYWKYGAIGRTTCEGYCGLPDGLLRYAADMGPRPGPGYSTERLNNDWGYWCGRCPECLRNGWPPNVRWGTRVEQQNNTSSSVHLTARRNAEAARARTATPRNRKPKPPGQDPLF